MALMATTGLPAGLTRAGISPPSPKRDNSVTLAASTVATPASIALPPSVRMRNPASTSRLLAAPTISCVPRTGGNMVRRTWPGSGRARTISAAALSSAPAWRGRHGGAATQRRGEGRSGFIAVERLRDWNADDFDALQIRSADAVTLGQQQRVITGLERAGATVRARIVTHYGRGHGVSGDGIGSGDQNTRLDQ